MSSKQKPYHHGNLPEALCTAAIKHIKHEGIESLTLRKIAAECDCTPAALYRHYTDKNHLLAQLATNGCAKLVKSLEATPSSNDSKLQERSLQYIAFAVEESEYFNLIFGSYVKGKRNFTELMDGIATAQKLLRGYNPAETDMSKTPTHEDLRVWSVTHGLAELISNDLVDKEMLNKEDLIASILSTSFVNQSQEKNEIAA